MRMISGRIRKVLGFWQPASSPCRFWQKKLTALPEFS